jgi:hypothetical protein
MLKPTIQSVHKKNYHFEDPSIMSLVQQFDNKVKEWKFLHYRCKLCNNSFKTVTTATKHYTTCKELNTIKKRKSTDMPIQVVTQNGQRMYRYGDTGKLYSDRKDAEKQAAAIMASGYKEPKTNMKDKK